MATGAAGAPPEAKVKLIDFATGRRGFGRKLTRLRESNMTQAVDPCNVGRFDVPTRY
jgi:hypothetical protein